MPGGTGRAEGLGLLGEAKPLAGASNCTALAAASGEGGAWVTVACGLGEAPGKKFGRQPLAWAGVATARKRAQAKAQGDFMARLYP